MTMKILCHVIIRRCPKSFTAMETSANLLISLPRKVNPHFRGKTGYEQAGDEGLVSKECVLAAQSLNVDLRDYFRKDPRK